MRGDSLSSSSCRLSIRTATFRDSKACVSVEMLNGRLAFESDSRIMYRRRRRGRMSSPEMARMTFFRRENDVNVGLLGSFCYFLASGPKYRASCVLLGPGM